MHELEMCKILDEVILKIQEMTSVSAINKKKVRMKMRFLNR